jgi:hypothetical protein
MCRLLDKARCILAGGGKRGRVPPLWDGKAAERIAAVILGGPVEQAAQLTETATS